MSIGNVPAPEKARLLNQIITEAFRTRNMKTAIEKFGQSLSYDEKQALQALTPAELNAVASITAKLSPLGIHALYQSQ